MPQDIPTSVYLYFDAHQVLIYVGITSRGVGRNREHNTSKEWWSYVVRQEVEHYPSRELAHAREIALIRKFTPPFNVQHNPSHSEMRDAYEAVAAQSLDLDPLDLVRRLGKSIPLVTVEQNGNEYVFRTKVEHSAIAARLFLPQAKASKVNIGEIRVGQIRSIDPRGPFCLIRATVRAGCDARAAAADLNIITGKPITFQVRRVRLTVPEHLN